jgi:rhodanese/phosphatase family protein
VQGGPVIDASRTSLPESYWVLPGRLLAGEYPGRFEAEETRRRMEALLEAGIDTFIDLTRPDELPSYVAILEEQARLRARQVSYQRHPILDRGLPSREGMTATLNAMDLALSKGSGVYVHCWGGVGRTGTTVGCFLVRHGRTGAQALEQIAEWWQAIPKNRVYPRSPETDEQMQFILEWKE